jgi:Bacteriophage lambda head decoration protein D
MSEGLAKFSTSSYSYDELVAGETITVSGTILAGQGALLRGTVLGKDGTTGKWARATAITATGGGGILVHDVDTTAGDIVSDVHVQGKYKDNVIILPAGKTLAETRASLHATGVYLLDVQE